MVFDEEDITAISEVLKSHFPNLKVSEVLSITFEILRKLKKEENKS